MIDTLIDFCAAEGLFFAFCAGWNKNGTLQANSSKIFFKNKRFGVEKLTFEKDTKMMNYKSPASCKLSSNGANFVTISTSPNIRSEFNPRTIDNMFLSSLAVYTPVPIMENCR